MPKIGIVYYADDPHKRVFRVVYPEFSDAELDQPPTDSHRRLLRDKNGKAHSWTTFGVDPTRPVVMEKIERDASREMKIGSSSTPASEPIVYLVGIESLPDDITDQLQAFIAASAKWTWLNLIQTALEQLPKPPISPSWIVAVDVVPSGFGDPIRQRQIGGHSVGLWSV